MINSLKGWMKWKNKKTYIAKLMVIKVINEIRKKLKLEAGYV